MKKHSLLALALTCALPFSAAAADWPERDISITVPYAAGGSTDLNARTLASVMADILKVNMPVTNKPGASGSVGTMDVWNKPHDGYNILANGMLAFTGYQTLGYFDKSWKDWHIWIATFTPNVVVTDVKNTKYNTLQDVLDDMKAQPGKVRVGSAGVGTGGHIGMEVLKAGTGVTYKHVPYEGGAKAITAGLSGEVDILVQLSMEEIDHIRAKKFKSLGALTTETYKAEGIADIPSVADVVPDMAYLLPMGESTAIMVPRDTPDEVVAIIDNAFQQAMKSPQMANLAKEKGIILTGQSGDEAQATVAKLSSIVSWILYDAKIAKKSPEEFGIPRSAK